MTNAFQNVTKTTTVQAFTNAEEEFVHQPKNVEAMKIVLIPKLVKSTPLLLVKESVWTYAKDLWFVVEMQFVDHLSIDRSVLVRMDISEIH